MDFDQIVFVFSSGFCLADVSCFPPSLYEWAEVRSRKQPKWHELLNRAVFRSETYTKNVYGTAVKVSYECAFAPKRNAITVEPIYNRTGWSSPDCLEMETLKNVHVVSLEYRFDSSPLISDTFSPMPKVTMFVTSSLTVNNMFNFFKNSIIRTFVKLLYNILQISTVLYMVESERQIR